MTTTKLINNVDAEQWRRFAGICKAEGVLVGEKINELIKDYMRKQINC